VLRRYEIKDKVFEFVKSDAPVTFTENTFTIMVGKNGTGKSRLLRSLVKKIVTDDIDYNLKHEVPSMFEGDLVIDRVPSKVICVSTSPFDKFPILSYRQYSRSYSYLGVRGLAGRNFGFSFLSRVTHTLINFAMSGKNLNGLLEVLDYLDYKCALWITASSPNQYIIDALLESESPSELQHRLINIPMSPFGGERPNVSYIASLDEHDQWMLLYTGKRVFQNGKIGRAHITLTTNGIEIDGNRHHEPHDILLLAASSLLPFRDILLFKKGSDTPIKFSEASSGEQSVLMTMLGIGSRIEDDALICIDEPELCLHPEWQERFIEILFHTFSAFQRCHFLIATHSPQIIAQLPRGRCYVMAVESGLAQDADVFSQRSIDFQLAEIFNTPGFRNEYLTRIALNLFARLSKLKGHDEDDQEQLKILSRSFNQLKLDDPLRDLIESIQEMAERYGRHH